MAGLDTESLTIEDALRPLIARATRIVDVAAGPIELIDPSSLPPGVVYERREADDLEAGGLGPDTLLITVVGADPDRGGPLAAFGAIRGLGSGGRFAIAVRASLDRATGRDLVDGLAELDGRVVEIDPVFGAGLHAVVVGVRDGGSPHSVEIAPPVAVEERRRDLRTANRLVLGWYLEQLVPTGDDAAAADPNAPSRQEVRRLSQRLNETETRLAAIETSTSYRLGRTVVQAVRRPARVARLIPDLAGLRRRSSPQRSTPAAAGPPSRVDGRAAWYASIRYGPERLFQAHSAGAAGARTRLVIAGVLRDETADALDHDAIVQRLTPNDAMIALERSDPDLLLIETGAFGAGRQWAYAGDPAAVERDRELLRLIDACRGLGRPTVLWRTAATPFPIGIGELVGRFDVVLDATTPGSAAEWRAGVQLSHFNLLGADDDRSDAPLLVGAWDERAPRTTRIAHQALLEGLLEVGLEIRIDERSIAGSEAFPPTLRSAIRGSVDSARAAALYRSRMLVVDDPFASPRGSDRVLEALACGARVVVSRGARPGLPADVVIAVDEVGGVAATVDSVRTAGYLSARQSREVSRALFQEHAVPVALSRLVGRLGLTVDPLLERGVTLIVRTPGGASADDMVAAVLGQTHRPREVVVIVDGDRAAMTRPLDEIAAAGVDVRVAIDPAPETTDSAGAGSWTWAVAEARQPWVRAWTSGYHGPDDLLDLATAAESSRAEAVGYAEGTALAFVGDLPLGEALIRREVLDPDNAPPGALASGRLGPWARRGVRLCGVGEAPRAER